VLCNPRWWKESVLPHCPFLENIQRIIETPKLRYLCSKCSGATEYCIISLCIVYSRIQYWTVYYIWFMGQDVYFLTSWRRLHAGWPSSCTNKCIIIGALLWIYLHSKKVKWARNYGRFFHTFFIWDVFRTCFYLTTCSKFQLNESLESFSLYRAAKR
jgi:hypothetical protein